MTFLFSGKKMKNMKALNSDEFYNAFGTQCYNWETGLIHIHYMKGTGHIDNGEIWEMVLDMDGNKVSDKMLFNPAGKHYIGISSLYAFKKVFVFFCLFDKVTSEHTAQLWSYSEDNGATYAALQTLDPAWTADMPRHNFYGHGIVGVKDKTAFVFWHKHSLPVSTNAMHYIKTTDGGLTWTDHEISAGTSFTGIYSETAWTRFPGGILALSREEQSQRLGQIVSLDEFETWETVTPQPTNLGRQDSLFAAGLSTTKMPAVGYDARNDCFICVFADRADGWLKVSKSKRTKALAQPLQWETPVFYFDLRPDGFASSFTGGLGYPDMIQLPDGRYSLIVSKETDENESMLFHTFDDFFHIKPGTE